MDPLSDILTQLEFRGLLYFATEFTGPWGVRVPELPNVIRFHLVTRGRCFVRIVGADAGVWLEAGDFVLVPRGASHDMLHVAEARPLELDRMLEEAGFDGRGTLIYGLSDQGRETRIICGHFSFDEQGAGQRFLSELPPVLAARQLDQAASDWLAASLRMLQTEEMETVPGSDAIVRRVTEIMFVQAVRQWMREEEIAPGVIRALSDAQLARAIAALHRAPQLPWTVGALAREAGLSRSVFAERFRDLSGLTPLQYVTEWRLERARTLLLTTGSSVEAVAEAAGYRSPAAFSRAYAARFGEGPGRTRRRGRRAAARAALG